MDTSEASPDIGFTITDLVVEDERPQICSKIEFKETPVRPCSGAEPNGRTVKFAEHAIYWLDRGKIARVVTVIDWHYYIAGSCVSSFYYRHRLSLEILIKTTLNCLMAAQEYFCPFSIIFTRS